MFENCSIMLIGTNHTVDEIYRLDMNSDTQKEIVETFAKGIQELTEEKTKISFDGNYKPNDDEYLVIENFRLSDEIKDAIRNPIGVQGFKKKNDNYPEIKAIFVGEREENSNGEQFKVAFQRFKKEQYISTAWYNLFFDKETFLQEKRFGISISDVVDCVVANNELCFSSFHFTRQIFDLNEYYRSATDIEVKTFSQNSKLMLEDADAFKDMANTIIRRKIALINDSKVLEKFSASEIKEEAKAVDIDIDVIDKKIVIPNDKEKVKIILGFLDEEAFKGPFSKHTYLANSKRKLNK